MLKHISIYWTLLVVGLLSACSYDEDFSIPRTIGPDGEVIVSLSVPDMTEVSTRGDEEYDLNSVTLLVVSGGKVVQTETYDNPSVIGNKGESGTNDYSFTMKLKPEIRSNDDLSFIALANPTVTINENTDVEDLREIETSVTVSNGSLFPMFGSASLTSVLARDAIQLKRNAAKVSVSEGIVTSQTETDPEKKYESGTNKYSFRVYGCSEKTYLLGKQGQPQDETPLEDDSFDDSEKFVSPTVSKNEDGVRPYVIVYAPYGNQYYYYRVNFEREETVNSKKTVVEKNIEPNHHYKIFVLDVSGKGYSTAAEASSHSVSPISVDIVDVCPNSYNMITDGVRELGVSDVVEFPENSTFGTTTKTFYVKVYSQNEEDMNKAITADNIDIDCSWLEVDNVGTPDSNGLNVAAGADYKGKVYPVTLKLKNTKEPGTLETNVMVKWCGLSRPVKVILKRTFNPLDLCSAELYIYDENGNEQKHIENYWDFLKGITSNGARLFGADATGDSIRNEGLHFPVLYGPGERTDAKWTYKYKLTFSAPIQNAAYSWSLSSKGVNNILLSTSNDFSSSQKTLSGSAEANSGFTAWITCTNTDYMYQVGALVLTISGGGLSKPVSIPLDLYHTGFFHEEKYDYEDAAGRVATAGDYCYYEVLEELDGSKRLWLDRNLGARTNRMYIQDGDNAYYPEGEKLKAGGYYHGCKYGAEYSPAIPYTTQVCPPGWEIPTKTVWAALRASKNFDTKQSGTYFKSVLTMNGGRRMYFPKYQYLNNGTRQGTPRAGYYWTSTAAEGLEKVEIKKWMQTFVLEGTNPGFERAIADDSETNRNGAAMAIRCVHNTSNDKAAAKRTFFNVSGVTHVYLYTEKDGNKTAATNWPGKFIGNYQNMTFNFENPVFDQLFYMDYSSTSAGAEDLYVIFNYVDDNRQIHTISKKSATDATARHTVGTTINNLYGWKVTGQTLKDEKGASIVTALGGYWHCAYDADLNQAKVIYMDKSAPTDKYEFQWSTSDSYSKIYMEYEDGTKLNDFSNGQPKDHTSTDEYDHYVYRFESIPDFTKKIKVWISKSGSNKKLNKSVSLYPDFRAASYDDDGNKVYYYESTYSDFVISGDLERYMTIYFYDMKNWSSSGKIKYNYFQSGTLKNGDASNVTLLSQDTESGVYGYSISLPETATKIQFLKSDNSTSVGDFIINSSYAGRVFLNVYQNETQNTPDALNVIPAGNNLVVVKDAGNWSTSQLKLKIYYWGGSGGKSWPGYDMLRVSSSNVYWFYFNAPNFIINNGSGKQTRDLTYSDDFKKGRILKVEDSGVSLIEEPGLSNKPRRTPVRRKR